MPKRGGDSQYLTEILLFTTPFRAIWCCWLEWKEISLYWEVCLRDTRLNLQLPPSKSDDGPKPEEQTTFLRAICTRPIAVWLPGPDVANYIWPSRGGSAGSDDQSWQQQPEKIEKQPRGTAGLQACQRPSRPNPGLTQTILQPDHPLVPSTGRQPTGQKSAVSWATVSRSDSLPVVIPASRFNIVHTLQTR